MHVLKFWVPKLTPARQLSLQQHRLTIGTNEAVQQILAAVTANQPSQPQKPPDGICANHNLFIKPQEVILHDPLPRHYSFSSLLTVCTDLIYTVNS